jgi:hypothetical protein
MTDEKPDRDHDQQLPVVVPDRVARLWPLMVDGKGGTLPAWASWPLETTEDRITFMRCRDHAPLQLADMMDVPFRLTKVVVHRITVTDDDGAVTNEFLRPTLIDALGRRIGTSSAGVLDSLWQILWCYGGDLPSGGVTVMATKHKTDSGRWRHQLDICEDQTWPPSKVAGGKVKEVKP